MSPLSRLRRAAVLASAGVLLAAAPAVALADKYRFDACGFNSQGWKDSPEAAAKAAADAKTAASIAQAKPCPPGRYWTEWDVRTWPLGNGLDYGFDFRMRLYGIGYVFGPTHACVADPPYIGEFKRCGVMERRATVDRYFMSPTPPLCGAGADTPSFGNPILPTMGAKRMRIRLVELAGVPLDIVYDTSRKLPAAGDILPTFSSGPPSIDGLWTSSLHRSLQFGRSAAGRLVAVNVLRGGGDIRSFSFSRSGYATPLTTSNDRLWVVDPLLRIWYYYDSDADVIEHYVDGQLAGLQPARSGNAVQVISGDVRGDGSVFSIKELRDSFGRTLRLHYEQIAGQPVRVRRVELPAGTFVELSYDASGRLQRITWPDSRSRSFLYEDAGLPWALTGLVDESGQQVARYGYDPSGRAIFTERAGANGAFGLDRFEVRYASPPAWEVRELNDDSNDVVWRDHYMIPPVGTRVIGPAGAGDIELTVIGGVTRVASQSQPAGSGCAASSSAQTFDNVGRLVSRDDFNGTRSCYARDGLGRETVRVEGLLGGSAGHACDDVLPATAALPAGVSKTTTVWHAQARMPLRVASPGRITTHYHHGQLDPIDPTRPRPSCAPPGLVRIDGAVPPLLCATVEQATEDVDGSAGFAATPQSGVAPRTTRWTYNALGQVLTQSDPATGLTTLDYHAGSSAAVTAGDLKSVRNALGHTTLYPEYTRSGLPLQVIDANGVMTRHTYDIRDRLTSTTTDGRTTTFTYHPHGALQRLTGPDGSYLDFTYDAAHRLVAVSDQLGHSIQYELDPSGQRIGEQVRDGQGALRRQLQRSFDALGRVQLTIGSEIER